VITATREIQAHRQGSRLPGVDIRKALGRPKRPGVKQSRWVYDTVTTKSPLPFKRPSL
jgi:hypothetical protein